MEMLNMGWASGSPFSAVVPTPSACAKAFVAAVLAAAARARSRAASRSLPSAVANCPRRRMTWSTSCWWRLLAALQAPSA
eukprot:8019581-Pyramimonas_sp.AAC.1